MRPILLLIIWVRIQCLQWLIRGDLDYLKACAADGLLDSLSLRAFRDEIARRECAVIALDAQARALRQREVRA